MLRVFQECLINTLKATFCYFFIFLVTLIKVRIILETKFTVKIFFFFWSSIFSPRLLIAIPMTNFVITFVANKKLIIIVIKSTAIANIGKICHIVSLPWFPFLLLLNNRFCLQNLVIICIIFELPIIFITVCAIYSRDPDSENLCELLFTKRTKGCSFAPNIKTLSTEGMCAWPRPRDNSSIISKFVLQKAFSGNTSIYLLDANCAFQKRFRTCIF